MPRRGKLIGTESRRAGAGAGRRGYGELVLDGDRVSVGEDEEILEMDGGDGWTMMRTHLLH